MSIDVQRPFRHLCPEADARDAMTDDEYWAHVAERLTGDADTDPDDDFGDQDPLEVEPCRECGEVSACAYDAQGRPLIHALAAVRGEDD